MKKLFVLLLALVVAGGLFAQATVNGYVRGVGTYSEATGAFAERARLNISYAPEDGAVKAYVRLQDDSKVLAVKYAYATAAYLENKIKLTGGFLDVGTFDLSSGISNYMLGNVANGGDFDGVSGFVAEVAPIEALTLGAALLPDGTKMGAGDWAFAAKYGITDIGAIVASAWLASDLGESLASASFSFTGVENLTATAGYKYVKDAGSVYGIIDYAMDAFAVQVAPEYDFDDGLYLEGYASYAINDTLKLGVVGGYDKDGGIISDTTDSSYLFGVEAIHTLDKAQLEADFYYDEVAEWSIMTTVKVSF
jgi:hypothetical protein